MPPGCVAGAMGSASTGVTGGGDGGMAGTTTASAGGLCDIAQPAKSIGAMSVMTMADLRKIEKNMDRNGNVGRWASSGARQLDTEARAWPLGQQRDAATMSCNVLLHDRQS